MAITRSTVFGLRRSEGFATGAGEGEAAAGLFFKSVDKLKKIFSTEC